MNSLFLIVDDKNIFRENVNSMYQHEDAAYNYLVNKNLFDNISGEYLYAVELAILDNLVINTSFSSIIIYFPNMLNDLQKQYIRHIKDFIKDNIDKLWIYEINKIDEEIIIVEHNIMDVLVNFDDILNDKLGVGKILINK